MVTLTGSMWKSSLPRNQISMCVFGVIEDGAAAAAAVSRGKSEHTECTLCVHRLCTALLRTAGNGKKAKKAPCSVLV